MAVLRQDVPVDVIMCDDLRCGETLRQYVDPNQTIRETAERLFGWQVRPSTGPGSRNAPDLCPKHRGSL